MNKNKGECAMGKDKKNYVGYDDLPEGQQVKVKEAEKLQKTSCNLKKKIAVVKEDLSNVAVDIQDYLERNNLDGVQDDPSLLYLKEMGSTPSFNQVLESVSGELPQTVVKKLSEAYDKLKEEKKTGKQLIVKLS